MPSLTPAAHSQSFTISEIFKVPELDIYQQMVCFVLNNVIQAGSPTPPTVTEVAAKGRMSVQDATTALQSLSEKKLIPFKVFRDIVGDYGDRRLSWAAKGLLLYLNSHPGATVDEMVELSNNDRDALQAELKELQKLGYLEGTNILSDLA
ncbi:hypothetical protein [Paenibacillus xerothermodurans]|uniref:Uncharacterized protein n=1 Tax=Paenibacillus xerothermodurans TaxID=1977292 RepID=A0A2W1NNL2_PAEXE|nr:hypothetical protein [Paenibacillus xerothermodurans]PZE20513.1 hypothetical protein CBW46_012110 [Paenibacillus xerothermodurans]